VGEPVAVVVGESVELGDVGERQAPVERVVVVDRLDELGQPLRLRRTGPDLPQQLAEAEGRTGTSAG